MTQKKSNFEGADQFVPVDSYPDLTAPDRVTRLVDDTSLEKGALCELVVLAVFRMVVSHD